MVCTRAPHPSRPGARRNTVQTVKARMNAVRKPGRQLKQDGIGFRYSQMPIDGNPHRDESAEMAVARVSAVGSPKCRR